MRPLLVIAFIAVLAYAGYNKSAEASQEQVQVQGARQDLRDSPYYTRNVIVSVGEEQVQVQGNTQGGNATVAIDMSPKFPSWVKWAFAWALGFVMALVFFVGVTRVNKRYDANLEAYNARHSSN